MACRAGPGRPAPSSRRRAYRVRGNHGQPPFSHELLHSILVRQPWCEKMSDRTRGVRVSTMDMRMMKAVSTLNVASCSVSLMAPAHFTGKPRSTQPHTLKLHSLEPRIHLLNIEVFWIKRAPHPFERPLIVFMLWIGDNFQKVVIS